MSQSLPPSRMPSQSRSRSRPHLSHRGTSRSSIPYLPGGPQDLILPEGTVGEEAAELLQEFVRPHHHSEDTLIEEEDDAPEEDAELLAQAKEYHKTLPWWKRPSGYWFLWLMPLSSIAMSTTIAPRIEIYTMLACDAHKPEYTAGHGLEDLGIHLPFSSRSSGEIAIAGSSEPADLSPISPIDPPAINFATAFENGSNNGTVLPNPKLCRSDPEVQAAVARLTATLTTGQGILAILTTAWWGSLSDRLGRTRVIGATIIGVLLMDFNFIFVTLFAKRLPGGYWFLLVGPLIEGCLGGLSSAQAAVHAYVSDCTEPAQRARIFSLNMGLLFIGMALGPTLGGIIIRVTGNILSVFYLAACVHALYCFVNWVILPESLTRAQMAAARRKYRAMIAARKEETSSMSALAAAAFHVKRVLMFFTPLAIFLPITKSSGNPLKGKKRDWNLTLVVAAHGCVILIIGSYTYKFQYAQSKFNWNSENVGYWMSLVGASRAVHLCVILPLIIKLFKPKAQPIELPIEPSEPLQPRSMGEEASYGSSSTSGGPPGSRDHHHQLGAHRHTHSLTFDLWIARVSMLIEVVAYTVMGLASNGTVFTLAGMAGSLGAGFGPAIQSVAVELFNARGGVEIGKLFGAMALIQAICSHIIGPATFGVLYMKTVATFPGAIFFISTGAVGSAFLLLCFVRVPAPSPVDAEEQPLAHPAQEDTLVDTSASDGGRKSYAERIF